MGSSEELSKVTSKLELDKQFKVKNLKPVVMKVKQYISFLIHFNKLV